MTHPAWLKQLCQAIRDMSKALKVIADVAVSRQSMMARLQAIMMSRLHTTMLASSELVLPLTQAETPSIRTAYALMVAEIVFFLESLIPQLCKRGCRLSSVTACSVGTADEHVFWELWSCLDAGCAALAIASQKSIQVWPVDDHPYYPSLYTAFHSLLTWLLSFSRSPAWLLMRPEHCLHMRNSELLKIFHLLSGFLSDFASDQFAISILHFNRLPADFLPLLCCIASEQFGNVPPLVPRAQVLAGAKATTYTRGVVFQAKDISPECLHLFIESITSLLEALTIVDSSAGRAEHFPFLTSPAVIQLLKVALIIQGRKSPYEPDAVERTVLCLHYALRLALIQEKHSPRHPLSVTNQERNSNSVSLPMHLNAVLSKSALETDQRLLHVLSKHMDVCVCLTGPCCRVQNLVVQSWVVFGELYPVSAAVLSKMSQSLVGLAKQCTTHGLFLMLEFQRERASSQPQQPSNFESKTIQQTQQHKQALEHVAKLEDVKLAVWTEEGMNALQTSMMLTSHFKTDNMGQTLAPNNGEQCLHARVESRWLEIVLT